MERTLLKIAFGTTHEARPTDAAHIVQMVGELAAHHGDTSSLTADGIARDALGDPPWLHVLVAESAGEMIGYTALSG